MGASEAQVLTTVSIFEDYMYRTLRESGTNWKKNANMPIWSGKLACIPLLQWLPEDGISVSKRVVDMSHMV
jgi:hypothetical protein